MHFVGADVERFLRTVCNKKESASSTEGKRGRKRGEGGGGGGGICWCSPELAAVTSSTWQGYYYTVENLLPTCLLQGEGVICTSWLLGYIHLHHHYQDLASSCRCDRQQATYNLRTNNNHIPPWQVIYKMNDQKHLQIVTRPIKTLIII